MNRARQEPVAASFQPKYGSETRQRHGPAKQPKNFVQPGRSPSKKGSKNHENPQSNAGDPHPPARTRTSTTHVGIEQTARHELDEGPKHNCNRSKSRSPERSVVGAGDEDLTEQR